MQLTEQSFKVTLKCKLTELKHVLTNLLLRLSKARLQQFLDQFLQPKLTKCQPYCTTHDKFCKQAETSSKKCIKLFGHV